MISLVDGLTVDVVLKSSEYQDLLFVQLTGKGPNRIQKNRIFQMESGPHSLFDVVLLNRIVILHIPPNSTDHEDKRYLLRCFQVTRRSLENQHGMGVSSSGHGRSHLPLVSSYVEYLKLLLILHSPNHIFHILQIYRNSPHFHIHIHIHIHIQIHIHIHIHIQIHLNK